MLTVEGQHGLEEDMNEVYLCSDIPVRTGATYQLRSLVLLRHRSRVVCLLLLSFLFLRRWL